MVKDLTKGKPSKVILMFSMPLILSMVFQQLYNMADSIIAGKMISNSALAAIGVSTPVTMIYVAIAVGCSGGISVVVANLFGQQKHGAVKTASRTSLTFMFLLSAVLTVIGYFISSPLVKVLDTPASIQADSVAYLEIYTLGLIFVFIYNASNAIFTGMGDSVTPLILLICSSVGNVILDIIMAKPLGVAGLAYATLIAQAAAGIISLVLALLRIRKLTSDNDVSEKTSIIDKILNPRLLKSIVLMSIPGVCQQSFVSVGQLFVQNLINGFGEQTIAAYTAAMKINTFCIACLVTMTNAVAAFTAQNMGAGDSKRVKQGMRSAIIMLVSFASVIIAIVAIFAKPLTGFFVNSGDSASGITSEAVINTGAQFLWITCPFYLTIAVKTVTDGVIKGAGKLLQFMVSTFIDLILRVALCYALAPSLGWLGVCIAWPIGWVIGTAVSVGLYASKKWQTSKFKAATE